MIDVAVERDLVSNLEFVGQALQVGPKRSVADNVQRHIPAEHSERAQQCGLVLHRRQRPDVDEAPPAAARGASTKEVERNAERCPVYAAAGHVSLS
jgi:hypothetical protein